MVRLFGQEITSASASDDMLADLHARVNAQGLEISRLSRELGTLKAQLRDNSALTVERTGCARIADRLGINERTVRKVLVESPYFARVREQCAKDGTPITRNAPFLAWLADNPSRWPQ